MAPQGKNPATIIVSFEGGLGVWAGTHPDVEDAHGGETAPGTGLELVADDARCAAQLARLLGVHPSAVSRTLSSAAGRGICLPPHTGDPDTGRRSFSTTAFLTWWGHHHRGPGRPRSSGPCPAAARKPASIIADSSDATSPASTRPADALTARRSALAVWAWRAVWLWWAAVRLALVNALYSVAADLTGRRRDVTAS